MTSDELKEIEARANAATEGPWSRDSGPRGGGAIRTLGVEIHKARGVVNPQVALVMSIDDGYGPERSPNERDLTAAFIAHARTDVPALIAEVRRLQEENRELHRRLKNYTYD